MIKFDYIIPIANINNDGWGHRLMNLESLLYSLPSFVHLILVEQVIDNTLGKYIEHIQIPKDLLYSKITVNYPVFNKPWLFNIGVNYSKTNRLLLAEMDVTFKHNYFSLLEKMKWEDWFFGWNRIVFLDMYKLYYERITEPKKGMAEGGIVCLDKNFYWEAGGGNEWLLSLGGPDNEFIRRVEYLTKSYPMLEATIFHNWHPVHKLKRDNWKHNSNRKKNSRLYWHTYNHTKNVIDSLKEKRNMLGDSRYPACHINKNLK
jgi:hypothetical protein